MVKGISKQVIVVNSPDKKMFDQAIFILSDEAMKNNGVSNDELLKEARSLINSRRYSIARPDLLKYIFLASGALLTGFIWLITSML